MPLIETAIEQYGLTIDVQEMLGTGGGARRTAKRDFHFLLLIAPRSTDKRQMVTFFLRDCSL
jgi:hypothetical protein